MALTKTCAGGGDVEAVVSDAIVFNTLDGSELALSATITAPCN